MSFTQAEISDLLQQVIGQYAGQRADYYGYAGECLSLVKRWFDVLHNGHLNGQMLAPAAGNWGSDYWATPPEAILGLFEKQDYNPNLQYPAGSLFVNTATHHIGILLDNRPGQSEAYVFQQNANPDGSAAHSGNRSKTNIDGILVVRVAAPAPSFSLTVQPMVPEHTATRYQVRLGANKWNLDLADFDTIVAHSVGTASSDPSNPTYVWITDYLLRTDLPQYIYYLEDGNLHQGWNRDDLTIAPLPAPAPQVIKTPNVAFQEAEKYEVVTKLMVFPTAADAKSLSNYTETDLQPGSYYVFAKENNAYNLSTSNVQNQNKWVRITDNVLKPEPVVVAPEPAAVPTLPVDPMPVHNEPVDPPSPAPIADIKPQAPKPQYHWIRDDKLPTKLVSTNSVPVPMKDLEGKWEAKYGKRLLPAHQTAEYSMYTVIGKTEFWIPDEWRNAGYLYGVDTAFLPDEEPIKPTVLDRNGNGRYDIIDIFDNGIQGFTDWGDKYFKGLKEAVTTVAPKIAPAKQRLNRTIEGITKKVNK